MNNDFPLFFIHIPKTAGSSFRLAAEQFFGANAAFYDYGASSKETHPEILKYEYKLKDRYLAALSIQRGAKFLSGHVTYSKYGPFFPSKNIVSFVRHPAQQVRSHFEHFIRHHGYKGSFVDFIKEKRFANMQTRALNGVWIDAIGFIGITERYNESIALFNQYYATDIKVLDLNKNGAKTSETYVLSEEESTLIRKMNQQDFILYEYALKRFERHKLLISQNNPLIRFGELHIAEKGKQLNIWASCFEQKEALEAEILLDDNVVEQIKIAEYRPLAAEKNIHRNGFVGIAYNYPKTFKKGQVVKVKEKQTEQVVFEDIVS